MDFRRPRLTENAGGVAGIHPTARHDEKLFVCSLHEFPYQRYALLCRFRLSRSEQTVAAAFYYIFKSFEGIVAKVEGTVESDRFSAGLFHTLLYERFVYMTIGSERSHHHAIIIKGVKKGDIGKHNVLFRLRIKEIAPARTYQHVFFYAHQPVNLRKQSCRRRKAALAEGLTEFYTLRSSLAGGNGTCITTRAYFQKDMFFHMVFIDCPQKYLF